MTRIRIGCSWARTSLPTTARAVTLTAEFTRRDLRDVVLFILTSLTCVLIAHGCRDPAACAVCGQRCLKSTQVRERRRQDECVAFSRPAPHRHRVGVTAAVLPLVSKSAA